MPTDHRAELAKIKRFDQLIAYLRDQMGWPIAKDSFDDVDDLFYDFTADELGIDTKNAAKIQEIKRLRPLSPRQPWGIFFVKFEPKKLPVVALRRILSQVALKKRASANSAERAAWAADDLLFVSNYGEGDERQITFAHFSQAEAKQDLPTLKVLGWDNLDTALHLDDVAEKLTANLGWPDDDDVEAWRTRWRGAFTLRHREVVTTSKELSLRLAELARAIRDRIKTALGIETERGPLSKLMKAFQEALIHDLDADGFADMYAQTITYGLLSARITDPHKKTADDFAGHMRTNPFLRELMETFLQVGGRRGRTGGPGIDFDELGVSEVVELLDDTNMEAVVRDFGDLNPQEDPVIHFYELFLKEYDAKKRMQRGVFYTPRPVVSYIVRSVHELLQTEFGLPDGLADTATWGDMAQRYSGLPFPEGVGPTDRFVTVLDVATGTGTFLVVVIEVIYNTLVEKWKRQGHDEKKILDLWNEYVPRHLLPRLYGYEMLMAPYAIAHLKVGLKLHETGYRFESDERARIYLTNTLEPASDVTQMNLEGILPALAHEAQAVNEVKRKQRFTVVIGNPPYSKHSVNRGLWIEQLMGSYKEDVRSEQNIQPLSDDYIKFVRFAHDQIERTGFGMVGFVTNHSYLSGVIHRGMRRQLVSEFSNIRLVELHGDSNRGEVCPDGSKDENVFDIQQGVAITLATTSPVSQEISVVRHHDVWGLRPTKYAWLASHDAANTPWRHLSPVPTQYSFQSTSGQSGLEYQQFRPVAQIFRLYAAGFVTSLDEIAIQLSEADLVRALREFKIGKPDGPRERAAQKDLVASGIHSSQVTKVLYRPFDYRYTYYTGNTGGFHDRPRHELMRHLLRPNLALVTTRLIARSGSFEAVLSSRFPVEKKAAESSRSCYVFPLYVYPVGNEGDLFGRNVRANASGGRRPNLSPESIALLEVKLDLTFEPERGPSPQSTSVFSPEDVFGYVYSILHSQSYRERYGESLRMDFPRVPLTPDRQMFWLLVALGLELLSVQLMESAKLDKPITDFIDGRNPEVEKVSWSKNTVWVDKAQTTGFRGVREDVWNFHIGGYQVCDKWLKDRKGRTLSKDDIAHYQKIVVALAETIRIMKDIDAVIEKYGGWPGAFSTAQSTEPSSTSIQTVADELDHSAGNEYRVEEDSLPLAAEGDVPFGHRGEHADLGKAGESMPAKKPQIETSPGNGFRGIDDIDQSEIMAAIRQVFSDASARDRETAMRDIAHELGFDRTGSRIQERLNGELIAAARRMIVANNKGDLTLGSRTIEDYSREYLKALFLSDMGSTWWDREDAINRATRYLGFTRTGSKIYDSFKSIINGLIREGKLESDPTKGIRRI